MHPTTATGPPPTPTARLRHLLQRRFEGLGPESTTRVATAAFSLGALAHLWLADAWQWSWLGSNLLLLAGVMSLWSGWRALGWGMVAASKALSLLFLRDHLTQSLFMLAVALAGLCASIAERATAQRRADLGDDLAQGEVVGFCGESRSNGPWDAWLATLRFLTVGLYFLAALHKLNRDFLDPHHSCAVFGVHKLLNVLNIPRDGLPGMAEEALAVFLAWAPGLVLGVELALVALYVVGLGVVALPLALAFHVPLTIAMAPAYIFVMLCGHAAFVRPGEWAVFRAVLVRHGRWLVPLAMGLAWLQSGPARGSAWDVTFWGREAFLWVLLGLSLIALPGRLGMRGRGATDGTTRAMAGPWGARHGASPRLWAMPWLFATGFLVHGLLPYTGLKFQHTGAMVSNLRVDKGCWNSLVFPESMRLQDGYVRVEAAWFRHPGFFKEYEDKVLGQLWNTTQLRQMQRNWCAREVLRPFYLRGTRDAKPFEIKELCAHETQDIWQKAPFGPEWFPEMLRLQRNLPKQCPHVCIH